MKITYAALALILIVPIFAYAQENIELSANGDMDDYLLPENIEAWEHDLDWDFFIDLDFCEILLDIFADREIADEDIYDIFPDVWELDFEPYPLWEDEWTIEDFDW